MIKQIWFDMDGTIADLYSIKNWLEAIAVNHDPFPYIAAEPLLNMSTFARLLHEAQHKGYEIGIISWLAKDSSKEYDIAVAQAKIEWLQKHLPDVQWNEIKIVAYGTPKHNLARGILFDDEERNRKAWGENAYMPSEILKKLKAFIKYAESEK